MIRNLGKPIVKKENFFFEKNKQKTFVSAIAGSINKSFLVLFVKKGLLPCLALTACAAPVVKTAGVTPVVQLPRSHGPMVIDPHVPPFASGAWEPFSRADAVAIALREWRLFGQPVDDDPPDTRPIPPPEQKPERQAGLWERVGEYWWIGQAPSEREAAWTGIHDADGTLFDPRRDGEFAWSAAFISYIMRIAGAGPDFPYSPNHSTYINAAVRGTSPVLSALAPQSYAPALGDLICTGRGLAERLRFGNLPTQGMFPSHCDIVVQIAPGLLSVVGGNVDDAVTMKHVPVTAQGRLASPDGRVVDTRYPWLVVLRVGYQR